MDEVFYPEFQEENELPLLKSDKINFVLLLLVMASPVHRSYGRLCIVVKREITQG
jgi:hypothetical protein